MTDEQKDKIAHALGIPRHPWRAGARARRWSYRNHYCAGGADEALWRDLEAKGFAKSSRSKHVAEPIFTVTRAGVEAAGLKAYVPAKIAP